MANKKILYDGKAKTIFEGPTPDTVVQYFKDDATANNAEKHSIINGKGVLNNAISDFLMRKINELGIPTHYIKKINMREQLVRKVEIIPVEFVVRNIAAGSKTPSLRDIFTSTFILILYFTISVLVLA
jgi:phosphoribosylaminoimidazole-succinocarboxamide synthase